MAHMTDEYLSFICLFIFYPRNRSSYASSKAYTKKLEEGHDKILASNLKAGTYDKLYSFTYIVNGFAVHTTPSQVSSDHSINT